jgi:hypothetical protein
LSFGKFSQFKKKISHGHQLFCKIQTYEKKETSQGDFPAGFYTQLAKQAASKING